MWDLIESVPDHCLSFYFKFIVLSFFFKLRPNISPDLSLMELSKYVVLD